MSADTPEPAPAPAPPPSPDAVHQQRMAEYRTRLAELTPRPWLTPALIVANVAVFAIMVARGVSVMSPSAATLLDWGGNYAPRTTGGEWWRLLTSMFVHGGALHLLMNMAILWEIGRFVERRVGTTGLAAVYLVSGLGGSLTSIAWNQEVVSVGASGAIFGCYGAFIALLARARDEMPPEVLKRLRNGAVAFVAYNLMFGLSVKGIDMAAHLGGLVAGIAAGLVVLHPFSAEGKATRWKRSAITVAGGLLLVAGGTRAVPRVVDVDPLLKEFNEVEQKVLAAYNAAVDKAHKKELSDDDFATTIERDVLPPWRAVTAKIAAQKGLRDRQARLFDLLGQYARAREEGWTLLAAALRSQDTTQAQRARDRQQDAEKLLAKLNAFLTNP